MSYIKDSLAKNEVIITYFDYHWVNFLRYIGYGSVVVAGSILLNSNIGFSAWALLGEFLALALIALFPYITISSTDMGVTNKRVILKKGLISRNSEEMRISSIETVEVRQSIIQRMLGSGHVHITGKGVSDLIFKNVKNPMEVKIAIENALPTPSEENSDDH